MAGEHQVGSAAQLVLLFGDQLSPNIAALKAADRARDVVLLAEVAEETELGDRLSLRIGVHTGPVTAGVIGRRKFAYDLWGDTVNTAARMESTAQPSSINMASEVYDLIREFFVAVDRGFIPVRGKGPVSMAGLTRLRPRYSRDPAGRHPNAAFFDALERWLNSGEHLRVPPSEVD